jgi:putative transcriptional regulator
VRSGLTQAQFAALLGASKRTLEHWEQGRREPSGAAKTLIRLAELHPEVLREIAA